MKRMSQLGFILSGASALAIGSMIVFGGSSAEARPEYCKEFIEKYDKVSEAKTKKCGICHDGKPKDKKWNDYGTALKEALGEEKVTDSEKIVAALTKIEEKDSQTKGKTFGDILKSGKLPGKKIKPEKKTGKGSGGSGNNSAQGGLIK